MSTSRVLVLGGIRSGKSQFAETLLPTTGPVAYLATAAGPGTDDPAWSARLAAHRDRRPAHWSTEEFGTDPYGLALRLSGAKPDESVLVDDLGGWLTAVFDVVVGDWSDPSAADDAIDALASGIADSPAALLVLVSPEVGLSVVPATEAGRTFADALGRLNRIAAAASDRVTLVVAGQPAVLKGPFQEYGHTRPESGSPGGIVVGAAAPAATVGLDGVPDFDRSLDLPIPDETTAAAATVHLSGLDFAGAGLGALAEVVGFAGGTQRRAVPRPWERVRVLLLSGAHAGGSAAGDDPTDAARRVAQAHEGTGALALLADAAGAEITTVECPPSAAMEHTDALTAEQVTECMATGWQLAGAAADEGVDVLVLGWLGEGAEAAAVAVTALSAGGEAAALLGRVATAAGHIDDYAWMARCLAVRDALARVRTRPRDPRSLLAMVGGGDIAVATGIILGATYRRTPVLIDGPVGVAAGLVARDIGPQTRHWLHLADNGGHPLMRFAGDVLGLSSLLHLKLRLGEGATSLAALPLLRSALTLAAGMPATPPAPVPDESAEWVAANLATSELPLLTKE